MRLRGEQYSVITVIANPPTYTANPLIAEHTAGQQPLPVTEDLAARLLCPALHPLMSAVENARIADAIREATGQALRDSA